MSDGALDLLADLVLLAHLLFVLFVVGGFAAICAGAPLGWRWVRDFRFRVAHLCAMLFVAVSAALGAACPLTVWEDALRRRPPGGPGLIERWVHAVLFYDLPAWVFTLAYALLALAIAALFRLVPPERGARRRP